MPRVLQCLDPVPASDGSCATQAWVELPTWVDSFPTVDQANQVGAVFFVSLVTLGVAKKLLFPNQEKELQ